MKPCFLFVTEADEVFVELPRWGWANVGRWEEFRFLPPRDRLRLARARMDDDANAIELPKHPH